MALTDNLISFWELEESSGTRNDSTSSANNLTDNNTVTSTTGLVGTAAVFTAANLESLTRADNASLSTGNIDFTVVFWVKMTTAASVGLIYKGDSTGIEYAITARSGGQFRLEVDNAAGLVNLTPVTTTATYTTGTWYMVEAYHDSVNDIISININNGTAVTAAYSLGSWDSGTSFYMGVDADFGDYMNGQLDQVGFWKKILSSTERSFLYNGGAGRTYAEIAAVDNVYRVQPGVIQQAVIRGAVF